MVGELGRITQRGDRLEHELKPSIGHRVMTGYPWYSTAIGLAADGNTGPPPRDPVVKAGASDTVDRVVGLETGADDYIAKPFDPRELLARVKSVLRRATGAALDTVGPRIRMGGRVLDLEKRVLVDPSNGKEETLTASEFDLLRVFAEHPNKPLQRDWLLEVTAHRDMEPFDRAIDLRITRLRRKIELDPAHPNAIRTVRGVGYMFVPPTH
jgi:DNA-binding response OmpR family regulator